MARITVKLFAILRERIGADHEHLEIEGGITAGGVRAALEACHPDLARIIGQCRVAVNRSFVQPGQRIEPDDEVALVPPLAGG